jgi:hypothetical protein
MAKKKRKQMEPAVPVAAEPPESPWSEAFTSPMHNGPSFAWWQIALRGAYLTALLYGGSQLGQYAVDWTAIFLDPYLMPGR